MAWFTHRFETTVALHPVGRYSYTVVYLEPGLHAVLPLQAQPRLRIEADVAGIPVQGAWQPAGGRWYLMLPKAPLRKAGLGVGDRVEVAFRLADPDAVEIPPVLAAALEADAALGPAWSALSAGTRRGLAHLVASARREPTQQARVATVLAVLRGQAPLPWKRRWAPAYHPGLHNHPLPMATTTPATDPETDVLVRAVFDDIRATRKTDFVNNLWRALAADPALLQRTWAEVKALMATPSHLDPLTKELVYIAVSIANNCSYCVHSHTAAARAKGMTDAQHAELLAIVGLAAKTNALATGLQVPVDPQFLAPPAS